MADTKITDLTEKTVGATTDEFVINDAGTDNKLGMDGIRIIQSQITDTTITATNLNILDDAADTTLHFHDADRARVNHTGTQLKSTISDFAHDLLSTSHGDTLAGIVSQGSVILGNTTPAWSELVIGAADNLLISNGTTLSYGKLANINLNSGVFAAITGLGVQTQDLDMDGNDIILDAAGNIRIHNGVTNVTKLKHSTNFPNFALLRDQLVGDGSTAGKVSFRSQDDSANERVFGEIRTIIEDTTVAGSLVHGSLHIRVMDTNVETTYMNFNDAKSGQIDILKNLNLNGNNFDNIQNLIHDQSVSGTDIDFLEDEVQTISIAANTTFTTANRATGKSKTLKIVTDATLRTLTFPAWKFIGTKPADQAASKTGVLTVTCFGTADTDIVAAYAVEA